MDFVRKFLSVPGRLKILVIAFLVVGMSAVLSTRVSRGSFERVGWPVYDFWQRTTAKPAGKEVVIVAITQRSIDEFRDNPDLKLGWPWPREVYGPFLETASKLKAKSVTFDLLYDSPSVYGKGDDESFHAALRSFLEANSAAKVVFPAPTANAFQKPNPTILGDLDSRFFYGAVNIPLEEDGVYRKVLRAFEGTDGQKYPSLGEAAVLGRERLETGEELSWASGKARSSLLRFYEKDSLEVVDFVDILRLYRVESHGEKSDEGVEALKTLLKEKHWILGVAAAGLYDLRPMPTDERAPGVYVHATHALNLIHGERVRVTPLWLLFVVAMSLGIAIAWIVFRPASPRPALLGGLLLVVLGLPLMSYAFWLAGRWFNPLPYVLAYGGLTTAFLSYRFQTEWRERERFIQSIKNSMSESMVHLIRSGKFSLSRFGERREISIMFSDLSGFTSLAESTDADKLVEILNLYLDECVDLVFKHDGYVDKFIGDAIMALWGAPVEGALPHAKQAFRAAMEYQGAVDRFNEKARERYGFDRDLFVARVGLHVGPAICGNIGSHSRYNYTVVGDSVNLASRLEGLGKQYDLCLLISEDAVRAAGMQGSSEIYLVDQVAVKGRSAPVAVYSSASGIPPAKIEGYRQAFTHYLRGEWEVASQAFGQVLEVPPARVMLERCQAALKHGELKQLKMGVWHHDEK
jgi:adenylate cyclase